MQLFYGTKVSKEALMLESDEAHHCAKVLRKKVGDEVEVVDGKGGYYKGVITDIKKTVDIALQYEEQRLPNWTRRIHLAIAPTKNIDRIEWMVEKITEIGVNEVSFILTDHSERKKMRMDRIEKKMVSAMKQSGQAVLPVLNELKSFDDFVELPRDSQCIVAHLPESIPLTSANLEDDVLIMVGPEGDFSDRELEILKDRDFLRVSMGGNRLRTETAGLVACTILTQIAL